MPTTPTPVPTTPTPHLVLGPMLRYVDESSATIWVETDRPCEVALTGTGAIDGNRARTFEVRGRHYALVVAGRLEPGAEYEYQVLLDGTRSSPGSDPEFPPSAFVTQGPGRPARIMFGSCRNSAAPETTEFGPDALCAAAGDLARTPPAGRPAALLLIGDQVYADEVSPAVREFIASRRDPERPPGCAAADFDEYCALYAEAWSVPAVRWLLSALPTVMIFDDHDVHDDWNISAAWRASFREKPWWRERLAGAYAAYWVYQHLGNLSPAQLDADETWRKVRDAGGDAWDVLEDLALRADRREAGIRWSVRRDFGGVRVVVLDSRSRRVVDDDGDRRMADDDEWAWVTESVTGDFDHVVLATSVPLLLPRGIHALEAWTEAVCAGAWGRAFARLGERVRQTLDLEQWASFGASFAAFGRLLESLAAGAYGVPPATVTVISGDIHHSYLSRVALSRAADATTPTAVWHAVCSPIRNVLSRRLRRAQSLATSAPLTLAARVAARLAGVRRPGIGWTMTAGPWFANMLADLSFDGRAARLRFDRAGAAGEPGLVPVHQAELAGRENLKTHLSLTDHRACHAPHRLAYSGPVVTPVPEVPAGWPAEVPPPGSDDFTARAVDWLLDIVPPGYRDHDIFRRWPAALASLAHYHAKAVLEGHRQGYRVVRTELGAAVPPHAMDAVMEVYRTEGQRHADVARAVDLVARALYNAA